VDSAARGLYDAIVAGDPAEANDSVRAALEASIDPTQILNEGMIAAMREVGTRFEAGDYFVPIGADGFVPDASRAVQRASSLVPVKS
jgi:methanogenic corrinoid protein MtbC1